MDILLRSDKCWDIAHPGLAKFDIVGGFAIPPKKGLAHPGELLKNISISMKDS